MGNNLVDYPDASGGFHRWHHQGQVNVATILPWIVAAFPASNPLVVSGSSAGGYGALLNYDSFRRAFPAANAILVDDYRPAAGGW